MRTKNSRASNRVRATWLPGRRLVGASLVIPVACLSCTAWPAVPGDGGTPADSATDERIAEAGAADREPALKAEAAAPACASDPECAPPTPYCVAGVCASIKPLGNACASPSECPSGHCVDGVCCSAAACPMCEACGAAGSCAPAMAGTVCTTAHASAAACDGQGGCGETQCDPGYLDCDANRGSGCETVIGLDNCGVCGVLCSPDHVTVAVCSAASAGCTYGACSLGYLDCDGDKTNGCETPVGVANCNACGTVCRPAHAVGPICSPSSGCGYSSCASFGTGGGLYLDCDGNAANGCESSPAAASTCGSCGTDCGVAFTCDEGPPGAYACVHE